jgi:serine/threonine protein phosphatase 1
MKKFIIGDIHGAYKALLQCLERSRFNKEEDLLITIGDIVDGWYESFEVVKELLTIPNRIDIRGNHDNWFNEWNKYYNPNKLWFDQGGKATIKSYNINLEDPNDPILDEHIKFFENQHYYYIDDRNRLFVHGGYNWHIPFKNNSMDELMWNRTAFHAACQWELYAMLHPTEPKSYFKEFNEVFIGHTTTYSVGWRMKREDKPLHVSNLWNLDTGAGWYGRLTIMDIDSKEYWQSDPVQELYPNEYNSRK